MMYAQKTKVLPERSRMEIERLLIRCQASGFAIGSTGRDALVAFELHGRRVKITLTLPDAESREFTISSQGRRLSRETAAARHQQACRQRWRALFLVLKAKLEAVRAGIVTFDHEFAMHYILPGNRSVAEEVLPQIDRAYDSGEALPLLLQ